jgi:activator of HSP90 ATPase
MTIEFTLSTIIAATPLEVYDAWMSSEGHSAMTGSPAIISASVGGEFEAWDGYIHGRNLELIPGKRIVQAWRTTEFSADEPDSHIDIVLEAQGEQTRLTLHHTGLPPHGGQYEQGWVDAYFEPMQAYFEARSK